MPRSATTTTMTRTTAAGHKPGDGFRILSAFDVHPASMDSRSLRVNWRWNSTELAKQIVRKTKITHFSDIGLTVNDEHQLDDPTLETYTLRNLQPDTRYTVCIQITRNWHQQPDLSPSGIDRFVAPSVTRFDRAEANSMPSTRWAHLGPNRAQTRTVTERECRVTVTSWLHWPALISSLVGILLAILISFSIFVFLKRAQTRLKKARREQKKAFCTDHTHNLLTKHPDAPLLVTCCAQGHEHKCPHHRCSTCHAHGTAHYTQTNVTATATTTTKSTPVALSTGTISFPPSTVSTPAHHHHHHHRHPHRHSRSSSRHQSPSLAALSDGTDKSGGEQTRSSSPLNPNSGDLLSIDIGHSLSGSDSFQFSSMSSADDRLSTAKSSAVFFTATAPTSKNNNNARTNTTSALQPTDPPGARERKRTVSFLLSERRKSITGKLRSKSVDKSILDVWHTKKLHFGFCKPKRFAGRNSAATATTDCLTNIPQVTVTVPDMPDVSHTVLEPRAPTSLSRPDSVAVSSHIATEPNGKSTRDPIMQTPIAETMANARPPTLPQQTGNVLSPTVADKDATSTTSSQHGSDREADTRPSLIPAALSVAGFKVALDSGPDSGPRDAPVTSATATSSPPLSAPWDRGPSRPISPPACTPLFERAPTQTPQDSSIFFTQLIETL